jgi:multisubunit Na+/H+ antiporter MnhB subunit
MVDPGIAFAGLVVLIVSLIMTAAFFTLNSNLEDENRSLKEKLKKYE